jgi:hypothetical protein
MRYKYCPYCGEKTVTKPTGFAVWIVACMFCRIMFLKCIDETTTSGYSITERGLRDSVDSHKGKEIDAHG